MLLLIAIVAIVLSGYERAAITAESDTAPITHTGGSLLRPCISGVRGKINITVGLCGGEFGAIPTHSNAFPIARIGETGAETCAGE